MTAAEDRALLAFERELVTRCVAVVDRRADAAMERARKLASTITHDGQEVLVLGPEASVALETARFLASDLAPAIAALLPPDPSDAGAVSPARSVPSSSVTSFPSAGILSNEHR